MTHGSDPERSVDSPDESAEALASDCPTPSRLLQLAYCSRAVKAPNEQHFRAMCADFAERNSHYEITGVFLCAGNRFVQVLEGKRAHVLQLATNIRRDIRHVDYLVLLQREIASRAFGEWTMAGLYLGAEVDLFSEERERLRKIIRGSPSHTNDPGYWCEAIRRLPTLLRPRSPLSPARSNTPGKRSSGEAPVQRAS